MRKGAREKGREGRGGRESVAGSKNERIAKGRKVEEEMEEGDGRHRRTTRAFIGHLSN